ncbi:MAG: hypothetical protein H7243_05150, partial [Sphingomonadaceae bacterium]|nr:hypothetical protein [Sphingomonadaceae bacterium]
MSAQFRRQDAAQAAIIAVALLAGLPALATTDETVRAALALHAAGKPASAYAKLAPLVRTRAGDPDFDYA